MIDKDASTPLHQQISDYFRREISSRQLKPGARLPSERELCEMFDVSRTTVRKALSELTSAGLVFSVTGKGSYVAVPQLNEAIRPLSSFSDDMARRGLQAYSQVLAARVQKADPQQAAEMGLPEGVEIVVLRRLRLADPDHLPIGIQTAYLPHRLCPGLLRYDFSRRSLFEVLRKEYGIELARADTTISAGLASPEEARLLEVTPPAPVLVSEQTTYTDEKQLIEVVHSVFRSDLYRLSISM